MIPTRWKAYMDAVGSSRSTFLVEGVTHVLHGYPGRIPGWPAPRQVGTANVFRNPTPVARARLARRVAYASDQAHAVALVNELARSGELVERAVVEDPERAGVGSEEAATRDQSRGYARIVEELPERLVVKVGATAPAYLIVSDTFDPGWTATVDGAPAPIFPAYVTFRAVRVPAGSHEVVFVYVPAGFRLGLGLTVLGIVLGVLAIGWRGLGPREAHGLLIWPRMWPALLLGLVAIVVVGSTVSWSEKGFSVQSRWRDSWSRFTWGAGLEAMQRAPMLRGERPETE
jgi:hypothetical protein